MLILMLSSCLFETVTAQRPELLYLRLNNGAGTTTTNFALPGLAGTAVSILGGTTFDSVNPSLGLSCISTLTPDGSFTPMLATNSPVNYSGDWTMEFWIRKDVAPGSSSSNVVFGEIGPSSPLYVARGVASPSSNTLTLGGAGLRIVGVKEATSLGVWNHVAFVHDSIEATITPFLNGIASTSIPQPSPVDLVGSGTNGLVFGGVLGSNWEGALDEIRVWSRALSCAEIAANLNTQLNPKSIDVAVTQITSPAQMPLSFMPFSNAETVSVLIRNVGTSTILAGTVIPVSFRLDDGLPTNESAVLASDLAIGESVPFQFVGTVDLTAPGTHEIEVLVNHVGDEQSINDTKSRRFGGNSGHLITEYPFVETFDGVFEPGEFLPPSWTHDSQDGDNWRFVTPGVSGFGKGASTDHTGSSPGDQYWACCSSDLTNASEIKLTSPVFDLRTNTNPRLEFWASSETNQPGQPNNTLSVDVIILPAGTLIQDVGGPFTDLPFSWGYHYVDLSAFSGQVIQVVFRADMSLNASAHDIAIDDIELSDHAIGPGQPPQPGLAIMEINTSLSPGGLDVSFTENGPYSAFATPGGPLNFNFEGEADQPIILMFGEYNAVAATFPDIGQMDIGGIPDPITGIPINTFTLFDGTSTIGLNPLFRTNIAGLSSLNLQMPMAPPGLLTTFQAAIFNSSFIISLSNAVRLEIE